MSGQDVLQDSTAGNISLQDRKDLEKFSKYFVFKCIQVIIQSRLGVKLHTQSKHLSTGSDWFNISIRDHADILAESKRIYSGLSCLTNRSKMCVEIMVKTVEGESMLLELWSIEMNDTCDSSSRVSFMVYNRMGVILKSLLTTSRVTPGYKLSRRQGPDNYVICYRMFVGTPDLTHLGDGYCKQVIGLVPTPAGTLCVTAAYRTLLLMSPHCQTSKELTNQLQDNHFHLDTQFVEQKMNSLKSVSRDKTVETNAMNISDTNILVKQSNSADKSSVQTFAAFATNIPTASDTEVDANLPFGKLLECANMSSNIVRRECKSESSDECNWSVQPMQVTSSDSTSVRSSASSPPPPHNFVLLELKTPFAGSDEDLGKFYRDCKVAPPLSMFQQKGDVHHMLNSITDQLAQFEANAKGFEDFVNSIQELDIN